MNPRCLGHTLFRRPSGYALALRASNPARERVHHVRSTRARCDLTREAIELPLPAADPVAAVRPSGSRKAARTERQPTLEERVAAAEQLAEERHLAISKAEMREAAAARDVASKEARLQRMMRHLDKGCTAPAPWTSWSQAVQAVGQGTFILGATDEKCQP